MKIWKLHGVALFIMGILLASLAWAETLVFETYYPSPGSASGRFSDLAVGNQKNYLDVVNNTLTAAAGEGMALIQNGLGIGITTLPVGPLHVVGKNDQASVIAFMPGADTATAGTPDIRLGIGTTTPFTSFHLVNAVSNVSFSPAFGNVNLHGQQIQMGPTQMWGLTNVYGTLHDWGSDQMFVGLLDQGPGLDRKDAVIAWGDNDGSTLGATPDYLRFLFVKSSSPAVAPLEVMRLTPTGNVGIGTTAPAEALDVAGDLIVRRPGSNNHVRIRGKSDGNIGMELRSETLGGTPYIDFSNDAGDYDMRLQLTGNDSLFIDGGNVGIGTPNPEGNLHVNNATSQGSIRLSGLGEPIVGGPAGSRHTWTAIYLDDNVVGSTNRNVWFLAHKHNTTGQGWVPDSFHLGWWDTTGVGQVFMAIEPGGNVGIGTPLPAAKLDVNGSALVREGLDVNGAGLVKGGLQVNGNAGIGVANPAFRLQLPNVANNTGRGRANQWTTYSSIRWKENIAPIDDALTKVMQLRGIYYDPKGGGNRSVGLVAEEVGKVVPEVVDYEEDGKTASGITYDRLVAVLIEAVKEQQAEIDKQRREIESLKASIKPTSSGR